MSDANSATAAHNWKLHWRRTYAVGDSQRVEIRANDRIYPVFTPQAHRCFAFADPSTTPK
jgi:hypothetical protein